MTENYQNWTECKLARNLVAGALALDLESLGARGFSYGEGNMSFRTGTGEDVRICFETRIAALDPGRPRLAMDPTQQIEHRSVIDATLRNYGLDPVIGSIDHVQRFNPNFYC